MNMGGLVVTRILFDHIVFATDFSPASTADHGDVWPMLSAMAEQHKINLIVVGTRLCMRAKEGLQ